MKHARKLISILLTLVIALALATTASATETTVTVTNSSSHTYDAYQIFAGAPSGDVFGVTGWGSGVNGDELLAALRTDTEFGSSFSSCETAQAVANVIKDWASSSDNAKRFADIAQTKITVTKTAITANGGSLSYGYYLLVDTTASLPAGEAKTSALLAVTKAGGLTISDKVDAQSPTVEKQVKDHENDDFVGVAAGDVIEFEVPITLPSNLDSYDTYKLVITDAPTNLTIDASSVTLTAVYNNPPTVENVSENFDLRGKVNVDSATGELTVTIDDAKTFASQTKGWKLSDATSIKLTYKATVTTPGDATSNSVKLTYSNDPYQSGSGSIATGDTPSTKVTVQNYVLKVTKRGDSVDLGGAKFKLYRMAGEDKEYAIGNAGGAITGWSTTETALELTSGDNGELTFRGLGDGTYYLEETAAPAGYNMLTAPIKIEITTPATATGTATSVTPTIKVNGDETKAQYSANDYTISFDVLNQKGATLPETGGIGTTLFYAIGGLLVLGAVVLLVTRKRMSAEK